jgi:hypothetical protein
VLPPGDLWAHSITSFDARWKLQLAEGECGTRREFPGARRGVNWPTFSQALNGRAQQAERPYGGKGNGENPMPERAGGEPRPLRRRRMLFAAGECCGAGLALA